MQLWYELYSEKVHVLAPKVSWNQQPFFRQKLSNDESRNEYLANDEPMDAKPAPPVDESGKSKELVKTEKLKRTKIKRGYGKKNRRKNKIEMVDLTLVGTNAAGIK